MSTETQLLEAAAESLRASIMHAGAALTDVGRAASDQVAARLDVPGFSQLELHQPELPALDVLAATIARLESLPTELAEDANQLGNQIKALEEAIQRFEELPEVYEEFGATFQPRAEEVMEAFEQVSRRVVEALPELLQDLADALEEGFQEEFAQGAKELMEAMQGSLGGAFEDVSGLTDQAASVLGRIANDLGEAFREQAMSMVEEEFEQAIEGIAHDAATATLSEIAEGMAVSQISAQITAAMSAQLPQLIVAKQAVGAVRRLLELMRAGF